MRRSSLFTAFIGLIALLLLVVYGIAVLAPTAPEQNEPDAASTLTPLERPRVDFGNPISGPMDAPITIVEFGDYQCLACSELEPALTAILEEYPDTVRLVWKDLPNTSLHSQSLSAAIAARCAEEQGGFWEYRALLLERQENVAPGNFVPFAAELGLDLDAFQSCIDEGRPLGKIERDTEEAIRLRVDGTPYLFINGRRVTGAVTFEQLKGFIELELSNLEENEEEEETDAAPDDAPEAIETP